MLLQIERLADPGPCILFDLSPVQRVYLARSWIDGWTGSVHSLASLGKAIEIGNSW